MKNIRIIPKLEVKGPNLIKGIHLEGLRIVGDPQIYALEYYEDGADELIYIDLVASLYRRKYLLDIIEKTVNRVFIPLTVGGGVKTLDDMATLLRVGADKIAMNTGAVANPQIIATAANRYGSQCIVVSIEAQKKTADFWEVYTDSGRTPTGLDALSWAKDAVRLGAGELLLTSINRDGTYQGFDLELVNKISRSIPIPVVASGGAGGMEHFLAVVENGADAVAAAASFHFKKLRISEVKANLQQKKLSIRV